MIGEEGKSHYVLITDFNTFILTFYIAEKKQFCRYCLQAFGNETISKRHIKDCFTFNSKKCLQCLKKVIKLNSKIIIKNKATVYNLCRFLNYFSARKQLKAKSRRVLYKHISKAYSFQLMISLLSLLKHTYTKREFTISLRL